MIASLFLLCAGAITFIPQEVKPIMSFYWDRPATHVMCRSEDLDGDGALDLITYNTVYFQRNGAFTESNSTKLPLGERSFFYDVFERKLFLFVDDLLEIHCWTGKAWERTLSQSIKAPHIDTNPKEAIAIPKRVLFDVDHDGVPEILFLERDALCIYANRNEKYVEVGRLKVWPRAQRAWDVEPNMSALWPPEKRTAHFLDRFVRGHFYIENGLLTVIGQESAEPGQIRYQIKQYLLKKDADGRFSCQDPQNITTESMPEFLNPQRSGKDGPIWFVGTQEIRKDKVSFWKPLCEMVVTNDNGKLVQRFRTATLRPSRTPFFDINGDGREELVSYAVDTFDGAFRETLESTLTSREVTLRIEIRRQNKEGRFSLTPDIRMPVRIQLPTPPLQDCFQGSGVFEDCCAGRILDLSSDMNGDGVKDLVIQDRPDRIALFLITPQGLKSEPETTISIVPGSCFSVTDLDGDGRGDIMTESPQSDSMSSPNVFPRSPFNVYLCRETKP